MAKIIDEYNEEAKKEKAWAQGQISVSWREGRLILPPNSIK
jgi:hypothetical protein